MNHRTHVRHQQCKALPLNKIFLLFAFSGFVQFCIAQAPVISSFSPVAADIGSTVTITGSNFNPTVSQNIVYFGAVRALVKNASATAIQVAVPPGADFRPISVTNATTRLTAFSANSFIVTFPGGPVKLTKTAFDTASIINTPRDEKYVAIGDIDGDGKPDIVSLSDEDVSGTSVISILENVSAGENINFQLLKSFSYSLAQAHDIFLGDLDGDGKQDILCVSDFKLTVIKNQSVPGNISFADPLNYAEGLKNLRSIQVNDIDLDGKPDVIVLNNGAVAFFKNISVGSTIQLAAIQNLSAEKPNEFLYSRLRVTDLDGDTRPDITVVWFYDDSVSTFRNISTLGRVALDPPSSFVPNSYGDPQSLFTGDFDGDLVPDVAFTYVASAQDIRSMTVRKNVSAPGSIHLGSGYGMRGLMPTPDLAAGDLNGDGKPDIITQGAANNLIVFTNKSTPCNLDFDTAQVLKEFYSHYLSVADLNGDGKPEIIVPTRRQFIAIYKNISSQTLASCAGSTAVLTSSLSGTSYQWQIKNSGAYANLADNGIYSGTGSGQLLLKNLPLSLNGSLFRCVVDGDTSNVLTVSVNGSVTPSVKISKCPLIVCASDILSLTASPVNAGSSPVYQWQDSTKARGWSNIAGAISASLSYTQQGDSSKVRCILNSSLSCASSAGVTSNTILIRNNKMNFPTISIHKSGDPVCINQNITITADITNGGVAPSFQWQDSVGAAGWQYIESATNPTLEYAPSRPDIRIRCVFSSSNLCSVPAKDTSNSVLLEYTPTTTTTISISGNTIVDFGKPANLTALSNNPGPNPGYQWQDSTRVNDWTAIPGASSPNFSYIPSETGDRIRCRLASNAACVAPNIVFSNTLSFVVNKASLPVMPDDHGVVFYPNPANNVIHLDSLKAGDKWTSLLITDVNGRVQQKMNILSGMTSVTLNIQGLSRGLYFAVLRRENGERVVWQFSKM